MSTTAKYLRYALCLLYLIIAIGTVAHTHAHGLEHRKRSASHEQCALCGVADVLATALVVAAFVLVLQTVRFEVVSQEISQFFGQFSHSQVHPRAPPAAVL